MRSITRGAGTHRWTDTLVRVEQDRDILRNLSRDGVATFYPMVNSRRLVCKPACHAFSNASMAASRVASKTVR